MSQPPNTRSSSGAQRTDWLGETFFDGEDAGNRRGADGAQADQQDAQLPSRGSNFNGCRHGQKLYHLR
jgi:hypothetical protein